eukprot:6172349-Pleurochrysis_carterae.AAC.5
MLLQPMRPPLCMLLPVLGRRERALALLDVMPSLGVAPDEYSYTAAVVACSRAGQQDGAMNAFKARGRAERAREP